MFHLGRFSEFAAAASAATMVRTGFALFVKDRGAGWLWLNHQHQLGCQCRALNKTAASRGAATAAQLALVVKVPKSPVIQTELGVLACGVAAGAKKIGFCLSQADHFLHDLLSQDGDRVTAVCFGQMTDDFLPLRLRDGAQRLLTVRAHELSRIVQLRIHFAVCSKTSGVSGTQRFDALTTHRRPQLLSGG